MFDKIGISVQGNFVRRQEGVLLRKSGRKLKSLFYLTIIVVLCIFLGGCNKKGEITFEQAADEVFSEEISNQSEVGESKETERMKAGGTDVETDAWIYVDVAGAVRTPGVVKLARGARVYERSSLPAGLQKMLPSQRSIRHPYFRTGSNCISLQSKNRRQSSCHLPRVLWKRPVRAEWQMQAKSISIRHQRKN